jgi:N-acetylglutamate synthase-like GNAT family acetyltransferase
MLDIPTNDDLRELHSLVKYCHNKTRIINSADGLYNFVKTKRMIIYKADNKIVAFAAFIPLTVNVRLFTLVVHPDYRRRGIATELVKTVLKSSKDLGYMSMCADLPHTISVIDFFSKLGFKYYTIKDDISQMTNQPYRMRYDLRERKTQLRFKRMLYNKELYNDEPR